MNVLPWRLPTALLASIVLLAAAAADAQVHHLHISAISSNVIVPQSRSFAADRRRQVQITGVKVGVVILEQAATTTMDIELKNPTGSRLEAELLVPVPEGAAVRGFDFQGAGKEPSAELLPKDKGPATIGANAISRTTAAVSHPPVRKSTASIQPI